MPKAIRRGRPVWLLGATLVLAGCGPLDDVGLSVASLFEDPTKPETEPLTTPLAPVARPAAPLSEGFAYRDLLTGATGRMTVNALGGDAVRVNQSDGCVWTRQGDWFAPSDSWAGCGDSNSWHTGRAQVRAEGSLWPLSMGSSARFDRDAQSHIGRSYSRQTECRVSDEVAVLRDGHAPTPAFVVECRDGKRLRTTWFAPDEGPVAFRKWHQSNGVEEAWVKL